MGLWDPCDEYKKKQIFTNMKIKQTALRCNTKYKQGINPMGIGVPCYPSRQHLPTKLKTWITWGIALNKINVLMEKYPIKKPAPLPQPSTNLQGKQICMYGLDTAHWWFEIIPEEKNQDQWMLIQ